jgi:hypothetical protein
VCVAGSYEVRGSIKDGEFLDQLSHNHLLREDQVLIPSTRVFVRINMDRVIWLVAAVMSEPALCDQSLVCKGVNRMQQNAIFAGVRPYAVARLILAPPPPQQDGAVCLVSNWKL